MYALVPVKMHYKLEIFLAFITAVFGLSTIVFKPRQRCLYADYHMSLPSAYLCAQVCLQMELCYAISFDRVNRKCFISKWRLHMYIENDTNFMYVYRSSLLKEIGHAVNKPCGKNKIAVPNKIKETCVKYEQCRDFDITRGRCTWHGKRGACDESMIGSETSENYTLTCKRYEWFLNNCKRTCRTCDQTDSIDACSDYINTTFYDSL